MIKSKSKIPLSKIGLIEDTPRTHTADRCQLLAPRYCLQLSVHKHTFSTSAHPRIAVCVASYTRTFSASRGDTGTYKVKSKETEKEIEGRHRREEKEKEKRKERVKAKKAKRAERSATQHSGTYDGRNGI